MFTLSKTNQPYFAMLKLLTQSWSKFLTQPFLCMACINSGPVGKDEELGVGLSLVYPHYKFLLSIRSRTDWRGFALVSIRNMASTQQGVKLKMPSHICMSLKSPSESDPHFSARLLMMFEGQVWAMKKGKARFIRANNVQHVLSPLIYTVFIL